MDKSYLEHGLPDFLRESISAYLNCDKHYWDCFYCELQSNINVAEVEQIISSEQAWYLREKYLHISREDNTQC